MPKETLKSLFYMFSGKPDSITKVFNRRIIISSGDIIELNEKIIEKLNNYECQGIITSVNISLNNNINHDFGSWLEFESHRWNEPDTTESISVKWDFLIKFPHYAVPQRHTISFRVGSGVKPKDILQAMMSGDIEDIDEISAPVFCRVDFINALLSKEILNIVDEWVNGRMSPEIQNSFIQNCRNKAKAIAQFIHYSIPLIITIVMFALMQNHIKAINVNSAININEMKLMMYWVVASLILISTAKKIGLHFASIIYTSLREYGEYEVFNFTNGDMINQKEIRDENKGYIRRCLFNTIFALLLNIIGGIVTWQLLK